MLIAFDWKLRYQFKFLIIIYVLILLNILIDDTHFMINLFHFRLLLIRIFKRFLRIFRLCKLIILEGYITFINIILCNRSFFKIMFIVVIKHTIILNIHVVIVPCFPWWCSYSVVLFTLWFLNLVLKWIFFFFFFLSIYHVFIIIWKFTHLIFVGWIVFIFLIIIISLNFLCLIFRLFWF